ncbi:MAG TPA: hypothetical protein VF768_10040, partial [Holophagaceae bacterium]
MAVSPVRALLAAHLQATWNQSTRELGRRSAWAVLLLVGLLGVLAAGPLVFGLGALGWVLGRSLARPVALVATSGLIALLSLGGGLLGGILGGTRQLAWETTRGFPLRLPGLYAAELLAGLGDLWPLAFSLGLASFLGGLGLAAPAILPLLPLVFVESVLLLLALQLLVGGLASALVKRLRLALLLLALGVWGLSTLTTVRLPAHGQGGSSAPNPDQIVLIQRTGRRLARVATLLPTHAEATSLLRAREGQWGLALALQAYPLGCLLLLALLGARLLA